MESAAEYWTARALLEWQVELGADEAMLDTPVDRYALTDKFTGKMNRPAEAQSESADSSSKQAATNVVAEAEFAANSASTLEELKAAMNSFEHCDLKKGARNLVFADGNSSARVMIIGEAPGRDEDVEGKPFVGRAGKLLNKMFAAIDMARDHPSREQSLYITNVLPWRPPSNRTPDPDEIALLLPFLKRHVEIVSPDFIVLMGNTPCQALLGRGGITRLRGQWVDVLDRPTLPMFHPAYLLRQPAQKREAWADLLSLRARLRGSE